MNNNKPCPVELKIGSTRHQGWFFAPGSGHRRFLSLASHLCDKSQEISARNKKIFLVASLVAILFFSGFRVAKADTIVPLSSLSGNAVWTKAASPYVIYGDLYILPGAILTIEPGVVVKFKSMGVVIHNNGTIIAQGTQEEKIYFTSYKDDTVGGDTNGDGSASFPAPKDWRTIGNTPTGRLNFSNVVARYAGRDAYASAIENFGGSVMIASSTLSNSTIGYYQDSGSTTIIASEITNNVGGFYLNKGSATITQSKIYNNPNKGVYSFYGRPIDARNNWWGDASGPYHPTLNPNGKGDAVSQTGVNFIPWLGQDPALPPQPVGFSSVAFIPGIEASFLYRHETDCTLNCENELWVPNRDADARKLAMTAGGESVDPAIYTREVIGKAFMGMGSIYDGFLDTMDEMVATGTIAGFTPLPYDWRFDLDQVISRGATSTDGNISYTNNLPAGRLPYMIAELQKLADHSKNGKVTLVAHSMGGLVAKALVKKLQDEHNPLLAKIDKVILVAVPELGTPTAVASLVHGYESGLPFVMSDETAKAIMTNMPSVYNLLPSAKYFDTVAEPMIDYDGQKITTASALNQFLSSQNFNTLNSQMLASSQANHSELDNWQYPAEIEVIQIAGWGVPTVKGIKYLTSEWGPLVEPQFTIDGDKTVVSPSATGMAGSDRTYYVNLRNYNDAHYLDVQHKNITELDSVRQEIKNIIASSTSDNLLPYFSLTKPVAAGDNKNLVLSVHSPITIDAYDSAGKHTGITPNPDPNSDLPLIEENIPNSSYLNFGEGKYVVVPDGSYNLKLAGTGFGTFTFRKDEFTGDQSTTTAVFTDIPVTPMTTAELAISGTGPVEMEVDVDGDGANDFTIQPSTEFDPILYLQMMKKIVGSFDLEKNLGKQLIAKIDNVIKSIESDKIENASKKVRQSISKVERKHWKSKQVSQEDKDILVNMLNQLIDNLK